MNNQNEFDWQYVNEFEAFAKPLVAHANECRLHKGRGNYMTKSFRENYKDWNNLLFEIQRARKRFGQEPPPPPPASASGSDSEEEEDDSENSEEEEEEEEQEEELQAQQESKDEHGDEKEADRMTYPSPMKRYRDKLKQSQIHMEAKNMSVLKCPGEGCAIPTLLETECSFIARNRLNDGAVEHSNIQCCSRGKEWENLHFNNHTYVVHQVDDDERKGVDSCRDEHSAHKVCTIISYLLHVRVLYFVLETVSA